MRVLVIRNGSIIKCNYESYVTTIRKTNIQSKIHVYSTHSNTSHNMTLLRFFVKQSCLALNSLIKHNIMKAFGR
jgi:hypothetical protein